MDICFAPTEAEAQTRLAGGDSLSPTQMPIRTGSDLDASASILEIPECPQLKMYYKNSI